MASKWYSPIADIFNMFSSADKDNFLNDIVSLTYLPVECVPDLGYTKELKLKNTKAYLLGAYIDSDATRNESFMTVDSYTELPNVKESKLLMYPYYYIEVTSFDGQVLEVRPEYLKDDKLVIESRGSIDPSPRVAYIVKDYNGATDLDTALNVTGYPLLPSVADSYAQYLALNKNQLTMQVVSQFANGVAQSVSRNGGQAIADSAMFAGNFIAQQRDLQGQSNSTVTQAGGSTFNIQNGIYGITVKKKMIKEEYRKVLEDFWHMYGYKYNRVEYPTFSSRKNFDYIKTVNVNVRGQIPQDDLDTIRKVFDSGVTFWHGDYIGDYDKENEER
ncbi:hypothetical protein [Bacillus altitudinis]|uniref:hypothetical protein n=1 Tax=Bacillus altitudinis TaxID=293387 RepID=UPI003D19EC29